MIKAEHLWFSYGRHPVLQDVSLELRPGRLIGIVGPNGCGKTTLLRLLARLEQPEQGDILLENKPYGRWQAKVFARQVALLPQEHEIPAMTAVELASYGRYPYLRFGREPQEEDRRAVEAALVRAEALSFAGTPMAELSGGQRQRVWLAMALARASQVLLLDEPTTFLDPAGQFQLMSLLRSLAEEGRCVAAVLHDLPLALRYCDELILMEAGRPTICGSPERLASEGVLDRVFHIRCNPAAEGWSILPL